MAKLELLTMLYSLLELLESGNIASAKRIIEKLIKQAEKE